MSRPAQAAQPPREKLLGSLALATAVTGGLVIGFRLVRLLGLSLVLLRRKSPGAAPPSPPHDRRT